MDGTLRKHGKAPYTAVMLHGGPGACGEMLHPARELEALVGCGILEPMQTACSVRGQIEELKLQLDAFAVKPLTLLGYSWGAWLALIFAAEHPETVKKLVLISCPPLEEKYAAAIEKTRHDRLDESEKYEWRAALDELKSASGEDVNRIVAGLHRLALKCDCFDPSAADEHAESPCEFRSDIFARVWPEAAQLRRSGALLEHAARIVCPVLALHGDYDPHPPEGVHEPLSALLKNFEFVLLHRCGHKPWIERHAVYEFMRRLVAELT